MNIDTEKKDRDHIKNTMYMRDNPYYEVIAYCTPSFYNKIITHPIINVLFRINKEVDKVITVGKVVAFAARYRGRKVWNIRDDNGLLLRVRRDDRLTNQLYFTVKEAPK